MNNENLKLAESLIVKAEKNAITLATAESCTGGLVASYLTAVNGASKVFDRSFITYSNSSKIQMLRVCKGILEDFGAVSEQVAKQMAIGAVKNSNANLAISITGIAGPTGESEEKPVGLVFIGVFKEGWSEAKIIKNNYSGNRDDVREKSVKKALETLINEATE